MKTRLIIIGLLLAIVALVIVRYHLKDQSAQAPTTSAPIHGTSAQTESNSMTLVESTELSEEELRKLEALFEPIEEKRKVIEFVPLGQSILCDIFTTEEGNTGFTFITPKPLSSETGESVILFQSVSTVLHPDGSMDSLSSPGLAVRENQVGKISLERDGRPYYSMQISGFYVDEDTVSVSAEFEGALSGNNP